MHPKVGLASGLLNRGVRGQREGQYGFRLLLFLPCYRIQVEDRRMFRFVL